MVKQTTLLSQVMVESLAKAEELAKGMNYVRVAGYGTVNTGHFAKRSTEQDTILGSYFLPEEYRKKF